MATPITWRTVNGPSLAEASRPFAAAQIGISNGFDALKNALGEYQKGEEAIWKKQDDEATQALKDQIYRAGTLDQFNALNQSGALDQVTAANGARINREAINALRDGRAPELQRRRIGEIAYDNTIADEAQAPEARRIEMLMLKDRAAGVEALDAALAANPNFRPGVRLAQALDARGETLTARERATAEEQRRAAEEAQRERLRPFAVSQAQDNLLNGPSTRALQAAQAAELAARAERERAEAARKDAEGNGSAFSDKRYKEFIENGPYDKGTVDTAEGKKALYEGLKALGVSPTQSSDILYNLDKRFAKGVSVDVDKDGKPIRMPLPVSVVLDAIQGATENPISSIVPGWSRRGDDMANIIERRFGIYDDGTINPAWEQTRDKDLIKRMQATMALRAAREGVLASNPAGVKNPKKDDPAQAKK